MGTLFSQRSGTLGIEVPQTHFSLSTRKVSRTGVQKMGLYLCPTADFLQTLTGPLPFPCLWSPAANDALQGTYELPFLWSRDFLAQCLQRAGLISRQFELP